jgi:hypothetical protein
MKVLFALLRKGIGNKVLLLTMVLIVALSSVGIAHALTSHSLEDSQLYPATADITNSDYLKVSGYRLIWDRNNIVTAVEVQINNIHDDPHVAQIQVAVIGYTTHKVVANGKTEEEFAPGISSIVIRVRSHEPILFYSVMGTTIILEEIK